MDYPTTSTYMSALTLAVAVSFGVNWSVFQWWKHHQSFAHKSERQAQDFHDQEAPRTGGIGMLCGFIAGSLVVLPVSFSLLFALSLAPAFLAGIFEDISKKDISPVIRLIITMLSGVVAILLLGIHFLKTDIFFIDQLVGGHWLFSLFCILIVVAGAAHSTNVIDGFNGLMLGYGIIACAPFLWLAMTINDPLAFSLFLVLLGSLVGLFFLNFPTGYIFSGDSGAYLLGTTMALSAIVLLERNPHVSPWFPIAILVYPVGETLFSITRKRLILGKPAMQPDGFHMHMIVYKLLTRHYTKQGRKHINTNAMTSPVLWMLALAPAIISCIYYTDTKVLIILCFGYATVYISLYIILLMRLLRFKESEQPGSDSASF